MAIVKFEPVKLKQLGKKGVIKPDNDGYYELIIGAVNHPNSYGAIYTLESIKKLFQSSSLLMKRIANGNLYGELGHPKKLPGMTDREYVERNLRVDESNICVHYKEVWLDDQLAKTMPGVPNDAVLIVAKLTPAGPKAEVLERSLNNPNENTSFSIRSFTMDRYVNGRIVKNFTNIVTWDFVNAPGIAVANKWDSPSTESDFAIVTENLLEDIRTDYQIASNEDSRAIVDDVLDSISNKRIETPIYEKL